MKALWLLLSLLCLDEPPRVRFFWMGVMSTTVLSSAVFYESGMKKLDSIVFEKCFCKLADLISFPFEFLSLD